MCLSYLACFARTVCISYDLVPSSEYRLVKTAGTTGFENVPTLEKTPLRKG